MLSHPDITFFSPLLFFQEFVRWESSESFRLTSKINNWKKKKKVLHPRCPTAGEGMKSIKVFDGCVLWFPASWIFFQESRKTSRITHSVPLQFCQSVIASPAKNLEKKPSTEATGRGDKKEKKEKNRQPVFSWASRFRPDSSDLQAEVVAVECERGPSFTPVTMFKFVPGWVPGVPLTFPAAIQRPSFGINGGSRGSGGRGVRLEHVAEIKRWIDTFRQGGEGPASLLPYCFSDVVLLVFSLCLSDVLGGGRGAQGAPK